VSPGAQVQVIAVSSGRVARASCRVASVTPTTIVLVPSDESFTVTHGQEVDLVHGGHVWRQGVVVAGRGAFTIWRPDDLDSDDARQVSRTAADLPATVRTDDHRLTARLHDLSSRGCRVHLTEGHLAIGDVVAVGFHGMELLARAMSSSTDAAASGDESPAGVTYGLAFQGMAAETQGQLFRLIGELRVAGRLTTPAGD
jgi:hypothetical protein